MWFSFFFTFLTSRLTFSQTGRMERFEEVRELGKGGMGIALLVKLKSEPAGQQWAVKKIMCGRDIGLANRALQEAATLRLVDNVAFSLSEPGPGPVYVVTLPHVMGPTGVFRVYRVAFFLAKLGQHTSSHFVRPTGI